MSEATPEPDAATGAAIRAVSDARGRLDALPGTPVGGHVPVFDEVHDVLQSTLAGLDER
ncbi:MAG TPA: hypothetical protein VNA14_08755 [Mycobacteriales bacterium]|nr:hypothetical protein [Mycobacteriales bacterium]